MAFSHSIPATVNQKIACYHAGLVVLCACSLLLAGCRTYGQAKQTICNDTTEVDSIMRRVDSGCTIDVPTIKLEQPRTIKEFEEGGTPEYWEMSLEEALSLALSNAQVLRDLGATIIRSPQAVATYNIQAIRQTDPQFGIEGALSEFDAQLDIVGTFQKNDRRYNNIFTSGGANVFNQDRHDYIAQLSKRTASGSRFALRSITDYDSNNALGNDIPNRPWQTQVEGEIRHSLLQGGGVTFNRIAGPNSVPGVYNGVLIAKINVDITEIEFEESLRKYVSDVMNAYWDLYFAYRDYDAKKIAVEESRITWLTYKAQKESGSQSGAAEALAREQYFRFQGELQDAIAGKPSQRSESRNGSEGGIFAGIGGVQAAERRLRLIVGLPLRDDRLLRPSDEPTDAPVIFDWESIAIEAMRHRPEIRKQRLVVEKRRLELLAAKNFLLPQLDLFGRYRYRGLDQHLMGDNSAFEDLGTRNFQEWEAGVEMSLPVGFRKGHAGVQNAQQILLREELLLREQERQVGSDLSAMVAEAERAYSQTAINLDRYLAAADAVDAYKAMQIAGLPVDVEQLLDAQRRRVDAQQRFHLSRVEYAIALKNIQLEKGSLLSEYQVFVALDANSQMFPAN